MSHSKKQRLKTILAGDPLTRYNDVLRCAVVSSAIPDSDKILGALRARDYKSLLEWAERPSPQMYDSPQSYFVDAQIAALIRKYPFPDGLIEGLDPTGTAIRKFKSSEHRCKWVNRKFRARRKRWDPYAQIHAYMRSYIETVIGCDPPVAAIMNECDFTGGASVGVHGNKTNAARKLFAKRWTVTPSALPYVLPALWSNIQVRDCILPGAIKCYDPELFGDLVREKVERVNANKITFVPKTAKTHRGIAVEPLLNGFVQKGTDIYLKRRLRRFGIDLGDQTLNQKLAFLGSKGGFNPFCTIDLSAASDSLAYEVVRELLPPAWFEYLCDIRSPCYVVNGSTERYEKFCSMGNGFCFPLETLIFASVCYAVSRDHGAPRDEFSVYGDDIIVRQSEALHVIEVLRDLGFQTNIDKTFVTGNFRESCGADWMDGQDVRPVHFAKPLVDVRQLFALHNSTLRSVRCNLFFEEVRGVLRKMGGGKYLRPTFEPGDTAYCVPLDLAMGSSTVRWDKGLQTWTWVEIQSRPVKDKLLLGEVEHANALMLAAMRGSRSSAPYTIRYTSRPIIVRVRRGVSASPTHFRSTLRFGGKPYGVSHPAVWDTGDDLPRKL